MKKKTSLITTIAIFSLIFSSSQVLAAKPLEKHNKTENIVEAKEKKDNSQSKKNEQKNEKKNEKKKSNLKHIDTLDKRLDDIENSLNNINEEIDKYFNVGTQPSTGENQDTSSETNGTTNTDGNLVENSDASEDTILNEDGTSTNESEQIIDDGQTVKDEESAEDEKLDGEFNEEYEEEDDGKYNSFYGKLNSLLNKLDTVRKQEEKAAGSSEELAAINETYSKLVSDVKASIDRVKELQQKQVSEIKSTYTDKSLEEEKIDETKKDWTIKLSTGIKNDESNLENITILDSKGNILDTNIKYDELSNRIIISADDGFVKGECYTILIGGDLESNSGEKLGENVEKDFTVE